MSRSNTLFMLSGSVAAFKAAQVVSNLVQSGHGVQIVATRNALRFVGAATLEGLSGRPVLTDLWQDGQAMQHIQLTGWADQAVLCPASANTLAKLANGLADDLVSALALAWPLGKKPFHIFPAMNSHMLAAAATQENLWRLKERGFQVADTGRGALACGEQGEGRLLEPDQIINILTHKTEPKGRVLITSGATREMIDGIRFISNVSTGQTGATLAEELEARGWQVTLLHGQGALIPKNVSRQVAFTGFLDLEAKLKGELDQGHYHAIIHAAAVSDYSVEGAKPDTKLASDQDLTLKLKTNPKLLPQLRRFSRQPNTRVIGFKLTMNAVESECRRRARKLLGPEVNAVVANDWSQLGSGDRSHHPGVVVSASEERPFQTVTELAGVLNDFMS